MRIYNFGRNVRFKPKHLYKPKSFEEVLDILNKHKNGQIRVCGAKHAWNGGIESSDAFLDISNLDKIDVKEENGKKYVYVDGGVVLKDLITELRKVGLIIPAMGGIMKQSVAGLCSTATHGTGNSSFSHFVEEIKIANYKKNGQVVIQTYNSGDELLAGRTAVGCMGVILRLKIPCIPKYWMTESSKYIETLDEVLLCEKDWPLTQTVVIPHLWHFLSFRRKVEAEPKDKIRFKLMRIVDYFGVEMMPHVLLKIILFFKKNKNVVIWYYKKFLPSLIRGLTITNEDYKGLTHHTRHHYTFRHIEMEVFIPERHIKEAFEIIKEVTDWYAGTLNTLSEKIRQKLISIGMLKEVTSKRGLYVLHYTPFIRKVFPDDSLISMTANNETRYAIGLFTYQKEILRGGYYDFTKTMAKVLCDLYDARLHWGKHFPLEHRDIARLYPDMEKFKKICKEADPKGVFQNEFTKRVFSFE